MKHRSLRERFAWHSVRRYARAYAQTHPKTAAEKDEIIRWFLIEQGGTMCQCGRWWKDATLDAEAQALGVRIRRDGEARLAVCPRWALFTQLIKVLETRTQGYQLSLL